MTRWEVLACASTANLKVVGVAARSGFKTAIKLGQSYGAYEVRALDASGHTLRTSKAFG